MQRCLPYITLVASLALDLYVMIPGANLYKHVRDTLDRASMPKVAFPYFLRFEQLEPLGVCLFLAANYKNRNSLKKFI